MDSLSQEREASSRLRRKLAYGLLAVAVGLLLLELIASRIHFQRSLEKDEPALAWLAGRIAAKLGGGEADNAIPSGISRAKLEDTLCSAEGQPLLKQLGDEYRSAFSKLASSLKQSGTPLVLLYLPISSVHTPYCRQFFMELARAFELEWVDLTPYFSVYPLEQLFLLPEDIHLSRLGHQLIAKTLAPRIESLSHYLSHEKPNSPKITLGGLPANVDETRFSSPNRPYRLVTSGQGFRTSQALADASPRILLLGDSFTFGSNLSNVDIYSSMLNRMLPGRMFLNAGIPGYTIQDELALFEGRAKLAKPNLVVLQTSANDLSDLYYWFRHHKPHPPSDLETRFFQRLQTKPE